MNFSFLQSFNNNPLLNIAFFLLFIWSTLWKGFALWHAASAKDRNWFVIILIVNTAGILEIAYLFVLAKNKLSPKVVTSNIRTMFHK
ncbi:hypothetical protein A2870_03275 [Candidatus Curtissbacteria bacterium RIFCSPHIGHO2_01_FULL_41_11]|uniref:DUF5652 domain-containing protein n=1 Tax=Candidatus Curtissbacteria bacterium RIFCSPHIGHO2_01_FULL_41_11 TaxID=1797711 RepID=A0A1F5G4U2_9BACT|nr:MAG: hypothetical protein A2870_03275 [Candidatus Curtissbacteria bacterium RIFCSPHIGHO2_01_FULL_41_11]